MEAVAFLDKHKSLVDFYAIDFISTKYWDRFPLEFKSLEQWDWPRLVQLFNHVPTQAGIELQTFLNEIKLHSLNRIPNSLQLNAFNRDVMMGMNKKKVHEIQAIASKINLLARDLNVSHILDIGGGQGYLSSVLALEFGFQIVAVDKEPKQIKGGSRRYNYIKTLYGKRGRVVTGSVHFKCQEIKILQDYDELITAIEQEFGLLGGNWLIIGLHCCGNLSVSMIRGFCKRKRLDIKALFNIGCCYQLLSEGDNENNGFPMTTYSPMTKLGICRKMVACQPPYRMNDLEYFKESIRRLFYRSILQKILVDYKLIPSDEPNEDLLRREKMISIKKMGTSEYATFGHYCHSAFKKLGFHDPVQVDSYFETYDFAYKQIAVVWTLRALIGDVIESLILKDRLQFIQEHGFNGVLEAVMDPSISPRNMALIVT